MRYIANKAMRVIFLIAVIGLLICVNSSEVAQLQKQVIWGNLSHIAGDYIGRNVGIDWMGRIIPKDVVNVACIILRVAKPRTVRDAKDYDRMHETPESPGSHVNPLHGDDPVRGCYGLIRWEYCIQKSGIGRHSRLQSEFITKSIPLGDRIIRSKHGEEFWLVYCSGCRGVSNVLQADQQRNMRSVIQRRQSEAQKRPRGNPRIREVSRATQWAGERLRNL